jgi:hypothetical protein
MLALFKKFISSKKTSFIISFVYVSFATLYIYLDLYNHYLPSTISFILFLLFLPADIFPFLILYSEGDGVSSIPYMVVCQLITFIGIWLLTDVIIKIIRSRKGS